MTKRPAYTKDILCFANSRKTSGRCVAGREIIENGLGEWVRPVSDRPSGEVSFDERRYKDGREPRVFDVVRIPFRKKANHAFQTENHVLDDGFYWQKVRRASDEEILNAIEPLVGALWNSGDSSYSGLNDRIIEGNVKPNFGSLKLISVADLELVVIVEGAEFENGKRRVRGRFSKNGVNYFLSVTDQLLETTMLKKEDGTYRIGSAVLCVSLGEPYNGYVYKLIAGVRKLPNLETCGQEGL